MHDANQQELSAIHTRFARDCKNTFYLWKNLTNEGK